MINSVCIAGNLTRDPELRSTNSGTAVLTFGVAVNERVKDDNGGYTDRPNFFDVVIFGNHATALANILVKGMKVTVSGRLRYESWEKDGERRSRVLIRANDVELPPKSAGNTQQRQQQQPAPVASTPPSADVYDEDIPF